MTNNLSAPVNARSLPPWEIPVNDVEVLLQLELAVPGAAPRRTWSVGVML